MAADSIIELGRNTIAPLETRDTEAGNRDAAEQHEFIGPGYRTQLQCPPGPAHTSYARSRRDAEAFAQRARARGARIIDRNW